MGKESDMTLLKNDCVGEYGELGEDGDVNHVVNWCPL